MLILAPSILSADFRILEEQLAETKKGGAVYSHIDVMDGTFVQQISFGDPIIKSIRPSTDLFFDVHLMTMHPETQLDRMAECGADLITFHLEAAAYPDEMIDRIHALGKKCGLAIKPRTPVKAMLPYMDRIDMLLIMTVEPGLGGQAYIPESTEKIITARKMFTEAGLHTDIEVDGGIKLNNVDIVLDAGANVIVAGSAVYGGDVYGRTKAFMDHFRGWEADH